MTALVAEDVPHVDRQVAPAVGAVDRGGRVGGQGPRVAARLVGALRVIGGARVIGLALRRLGLLLAGLRLAGLRLGLGGESSGFKNGG